MIDGSDLEEMKHAAQKACLVGGSVEISGPDLLEAFSFVDDVLEELDEYQNLGRVEKVEERLEALAKLEDDFAEGGDVGDLHASLERLAKLDALCEEYGEILTINGHKIGVIVPEKLREALQTLAKLKEPKPAPKKRAAPKRAK